MNTQDFTTTILVNSTPMEAFNAINNVSGWWSEEIGGPTDQLGEEFNYHFEDIHRCRIKVMELVPGQKVVWQVMENYFKPGIFGDNSGHSVDQLAQDQTEWANTTMVFEITRKGDKTQVHFTHLGLVPSYECYDTCVNGWTHYIRQSLQALITTGKGHPNRTGNPQTSDEEKLHAAVGKA